MDTQRSYQIFSLLYTYIVTKVETNLHMEVPLKHIKSSVPLEIQIVITNISLCIFLCF